MMIMPFIRLLTIYALVIVAVVVFFKRDALMQFSSTTFGWPISQSAPAKNAENPAQEPEQTLETTPATALVADPAPQTAEAKPSVMQMPSAEPETEENTSEAVPNLVASAQPVVENPTAAEIQTRLNAARQAYWKGDLSAAETLYSALARDVSGNPDITGELGNLLFAQRDYDNAAKAYFVTARLLIENGQTQQAQPIIAVLQNIAPKKAATLRALANN